MNSDILFLEQYLELALSGLKAEQNSMEQALYEKDDAWFETATKRASGQTQLVSALRNHIELLKYQR